MQTLDNLAMTSGWKINQIKGVKMEKKNLWLILTIIAFIALIASIYMSYKTGKTEYAWIIGTMLFGIGCGNKYKKEK